MAPERFALKLNLMLACVVMDCLCNGFADHMWGPDQMPHTVALCALSVVLHLLMLLLFFLLMGHTFLLRYGLLLEMWSEFRGVLLFSLVRFAVLGVARVPRFLAAIEDWKPEEYWDNPLHHGMFFLHNIMTVVFDAWLLRRSHSLARVRYYKPQLWQKHRRRVANKSTVPGSYGPSVLT